MFYDKGSYSDGWRYLEAAPADLRVIGGVPTVDANAAGYDTATKKFYFGFYRTSPEGENLAIDAKDKVGTGKENTKKFYEAMGEENAYKTLDATKPFIEYPARLCSILKYTDADGKTYDDWFLPSLNEMKQMSEKLIKNGLGSFEEEYFHSSITGRGETPFDFWAYRVSNEVWDWYNISCNRQLSDAFIRPIRAF